MNVLFLDTAHPSLIEGLRKAGFTCDEDYEGTRYEGRGMGYEGIVIRSRLKLDASLIDAFPKLKFIARVGAGMENIDVAFAESRGIRCLHAPEGNRSAVAEHGLGMLLMLTNNLRKADAEVRNGIWKREENRGHEIEGKTFAIIGYGNMGSAIGERLKGFGCRIITHDKYKNRQQLSEECRRAGVQAVEMKEVFDTADIVSLHLPMTEETHYYADETFFPAFRKPIYFLNTARGKNVKTAALVQAIRDGNVRGACLDVLEYESGSFEDISSVTNPDLEFLKGSEKVILSPHIAGWTQESNEKMAKVLLEKILQVYKGK